MKNIDWLVVIVERALFIGRFQPPHLGHLKLIEYALDQVDELVILIAAAQVSHTIKNLNQAGVEIAIVIGGGNFLRGANYAQNGFDRVTSDSLGMLATVMNGLALQNSLQKIDVATHVMSAITIEKTVETFERNLAKTYLKNGEIVLLPCCLWGFFQTAISLTS